jgi:hypothetical protein
MADKMVEGKKLGSSKSYAAAVDNLNVYRQDQWLTPTEASVKQAPRDLSIATAETAASQPLARKSYFTNKKNFTLKL